MGMLLPGDDVESFVVAPPVPDPGDLRRARRVIAGVLLATGAPTAPELARAGVALGALGWPPLTERDLVIETPETLAPAIPPELRPGVLHVLYELAGDEPIRRQLADTYAGLWHDQPQAPPPRRRGSAAVRWLIGRLPRHQVGSAAEEDDMVERSGPYRGGEVAPPQLAPVERTPLRRRVERIRDEYHQVVDAVERVIVGKRDVIEPRAHRDGRARPRAARRRPRRRQDPAVQGDRRGDRDPVRADPVHARSAADGHHRRERVRRPRQAVPLPPRADLHPHPARRRDQPRDAQDPVGAARGDGGALRHGRRRDPRARGAVPGARDDEPDRSPGHVRAARGADRSLHGDARDRLSVARRRGQGARLPPRRDAAAVDRHAGDLARRVRRLARHGAAHPRQPRAQARRRSTTSTGCAARSTTATRSARGRRWRGCARRRPGRCSSGREFVTIDDLLHVAPDVLRHRLWTDGATVHERLRAIANAGVRS